MNFDVIVNNLPFLLKGLSVTLKVSVISIILSMLFGTFLGVIRYFKVPAVSKLVAIFVDITRSIPLILYIIFIHFSISPYLYNNMVFLKYIGVNCLEMFSAILSIIIFTSAYIAEIIRSGIESVEKDQILTAKALGLNSFQTMEYVVLPQAITRMRPSLCAQFITLVKDTSLASAVGLVELTRASEIVYETSMHEFQVLLFVATLYICINFLIQKIFVSNQVIERKIIY